MQNIVKNAEASASENFEDIEITDGSSVSKRLKSINNVFFHTCLYSTLGILSNIFDAFLGASLYLIYQGRQSGGIPRDLEGQAEFWKAHYRPGETAERFLNAIENRNEGIVIC